MARKLPPEFLYFFILLTVSAFRHKIKPAPEMADLRLPRKQNQGEKQ
jgi:hypothetical protein